MDFYTLDVRNLGQAEGAHKVGASMGSLKMLAFLGYKQRTSRKTTETLAFRVESEAPKTPHQSVLFYRTDSFLTPTPKMQAFPGTPEGGSLIRPLSFISYRCVKKT